MASAKRQACGGAARWRRLAPLALLLILLAAWGARPVSASWQSRVAPSVLAQATDGETTFLVHLSARADLRPAATITDLLDRRQWVIARLQSTAERSQRPLRPLLEQHGAGYRAFWIGNLIWVRGDLALLVALAQQPGVARITPDSRLLSIGPEPPRQAPAPDNPTAGPEWNLSHIGAPGAWAQGVVGSGIVIGGQDTGYAWQHPALRSSYRGWDGVAATHDYNWHDAIHEDDAHTPPGNPCGYDSPEPCDDDGHGTHTMGTLVGDDGLGNQIGVAPGARWIGCRNMEQAWGRVSTYTECFQWFVAPTDGNDANPDPTRAPHVISNSWSCPPSEGCTDVDVLRTVVENVRAAGIVVVASAGNAGPSCASIAAPPAIYDASLTVGATDFQANSLAAYSSRGPVLADGSGRLKPDLVAPGSSVRSSLPPDGYGLKSGTSMAAPHVAAVVALMLQANPTLIGQVDLVEGLLRQSAQPLTVAESCGGVPGTDVPNNSTGFGRVDAVSAVALARTPPGWQTTLMPAVLHP